MSEVTNPIQACNDIFLKPNGVFKALSEKDNWSWVPFFIVVIMASVPGYLYFGVVDFDWYQTIQIQTQMPDASPAEIENMKAFSNQDLAQNMALFVTGIFIVVLSAITALYFTLVTRNDEKSIHSFLDWYGAQWWILLPIIFNSLISCVLILFTDSGAQVSESILAPLSLAFMFGVDQTSEWFRLLVGLRLDSLWSIYLASVCVGQWTNFSKKKSIIVACIPTVIIVSLTFIFTVL